MLVSEKLYAYHPFSILKYTIRLCNKINIFPKYSTDISVGNKFQEAGMHIYPKNLQVQMRCGLETTTKAKQSGSKYLISNFAMGLLNDWCK